MKNEAVMSPMTASSVIDALDKGLNHVETICVHLYGGEPFTNLDAAEAMVKRASGKKPGRFSFAVTTNGTLFSKEIAELLKAGNFKIVLSVDGPPDVHNECRRTVGGAPTHTDVINFLNNVRSQTSCTICGSSVVRSGWRLKSATEYLRTLPVDSIKAQAVRAPAGNPYSLTKAEKKTYMNDLEAIGQRVIEELEAGGLPKDNRFSSRALQLLKGEKRRSFCGAGLTTFGITPSGNVLPCILIESDSAALGHINDNPETWVQKGSYWRERPLKAECKSCKSLHLCGGGCPAIMPVCGEDECEIIRKNCEVAVSIFERFRNNPEALLALAGIT